MEARRHSRGFAPLTLSGLRESYETGSARPSDIAEEVLERVEAQGADAVWISTLAPERVRARARELDALERAGGARDLPLFGVPFAVKDNIDVAGLPTTAGCPAFAYEATRSATVVRRLEALGAFLVGKTNLDQFATGLVGVRSPYGVPRNPFAAAYVPGGSSSGSAVAVATGSVAFALGTDTAGSGRIPAAFNNIVGIKPTIGLVSAAGVVPACRSLDCVSVFASTVEDGMRVLSGIAGFDEDDPFSRAAPAGFGFDPVAPGAAFAFAVPGAADLHFCADREYERLFAEAVRRMETIGGRRREIPFAPFAEAATLLYSDAGVAERVAAIGDFLRDHPESVLPVTRAVIDRGRNATAVDVYRARERLAGLRARALASLDGCAFLLVPSAPTIWRIADIERDPVALNTALGSYTNFVNPMDFAAIAVPSGFTAAGLPFGVTLVGHAFSEPMLAGFAAAFHRAAGLPLGASGRC